MTDLVTGPLEQLSTGHAFTEGPAWMGDALLFTDIPNNAILRWTPDGVAPWVENAHFAIGLTPDGQGGVLACEHSTRSLSRLTAGAREVLASTYEGRVLNSTNDVIRASGGTILFTDPPFGVRTLDGALHGYQQAMELSGAWVFALDADGLRPVATDIYRPNGLCLNRAETVLYVSDSSEAHHKVVAMDVGPGWTLSAPRDFAVMPVGVPDGMRIDAEDRLWIAGGDGVYVHAPDGAQVGHVPVPEMVTNVEFGGADLSELFITATTSLYRVPTATRGGRA